MDTNVIAIAKRVQHGEISAADLPTGSARLFYSELEKGAQATRKAGESDAQAFARFATTDPSGQALMAAHSALTRPRAQVATEAAPARDVRKAAGDLALELKAEELYRREPHLTSAQAYSRIAQDPANAGLLAQALGKAAMPNPTPSVPETPSLAKLTELALALMELRPSLTFAIAFAQVLGTPAGAALYDAMQAERVAPWLSTTEASRRHVAGNGPAPAVTKTGMMTVAQMSLASEIL